jgi:alpha-L-arabinofuranosidase
VAVVNPTAERRQVTVDLRGARAGRRVERFVLTGADRWAHNAPGRRRGVSIERRAVSESGGTIESPPLSVTLHRLALE